MKKAEQRWKVNYLEHRKNGAEAWGASVRRLKASAQSHLLLLLLPIRESDFQAGKGRKDPVRRETKPQMVGENQVALND